MPKTKIKSQESGFSFERQKEQILWSQNREPGAPGFKPSLIKEVSRNYERDLWESCLCPEFTPAHDLTWLDSGSCCLQFVHRVFIRRLLCVMIKDTAHILLSCCTNPSFTPSPQSSQINWNYWFSSKGNWSYYNRVWAIQATSITRSRRAIRTKSGSLWNSYQVFMGCKNWREFRNYDSIKLPEDWSNIRTRFMNSRYRMRSIVWMTWEFFKDAGLVRSGLSTFPLNQRYSHFIVILEGCRAAWQAARYVGYAWFSGNVFVNLPASSSLFPGGFNPWISNVTEDIYRMWPVNVETKTQLWIQDASQDRQPEIHSILVREDIQRIMVPTNEDCSFGSSFWQIPHASHVCLLEDKIQSWGMYLFTISYGSFAVDERSGDGWISEWSQIFVFCNRN